MTRWLDGLGWLKWPSVILVASPIAAYPFWSPEPKPSVDCGLVDVKGQLFRAYRRVDAGDVILRPAPPAAGRAVTPLADVEPAGFDSGGMVLDPQTSGLRGLRCRSTSKGK